MGHPGSSPGPVKRFPIPEPIAENMLYRSRTNRKIWGVAGGLGEHFGTDPAIVRTIFIVFLLFAGFSAFLYLFLAVMMPLEPEPSSDPSDPEECGPRPGDG